MTTSGDTKVRFTTVGCRLNQAESDAMAEQLAAVGARPAGSDERADIVVINTCTVTGEATRGSRQAIKRAVRAHPGAKVVVTGCYATASPEEVAAIDGVDVVLANDAKDDFAAAVGASPAAPLLQIRSLRGPRSPAPVRVRANLKVQTGCDEWCSFCIIPTTRGPLRSYDVSAIVDEARARVAAGARELVLTGVHLGKFDYDRGGDEHALVDLLGHLVSIEGAWRIRLSSILSRHLTNEVVEFIAAEPRICRHLHVPLQSGDDRVLHDMNRPYSIAEYVESVERAAAAIPGLALATDVIVGFPTESDGAFENTMAVVRRLGFTKLHVFRYSPRSGTAAADLEDSVPTDVKKQRSKRLIDLGNRMRTRWLRDHLDRPLEVLVEDERIADGACVCSGQTGDYVRVWFEGRGLLGSLVEVVGSEVRADGIRGARLRRVLRT